MTTMINRQRGNERDNPFAMRQTRWHNPTSQRMQVTLHTESNRPQVVTWEPGETVTLSAEYDNAIHRVDCGQELCHKGAGRRGGGWHCTKGHNGTIVGGLAPLLVRIDGEGEPVGDTLDEALDPQAAKKKETEAAVAAAAIANKSAQEALVIAAARANVASGQAAAAQNAADASKPAKK